MENSINISNAFFVVIDYVAKNCNTQANTHKKKEKKSVYQYTKVYIHIYIETNYRYYISSISLYIHNSTTILFFFFHFFLT